MEDVLLNLNKPWNWFCLSKHPNVTMDHIAQHPELPWVWKAVGNNPNLTVEFVLQNLEKPWKAFIFENSMDMCRTKAIEDRIEKEKNLYWLRRVQQQNADFPRELFAMIEGYF